jgi:aryl carrier-like protein
MVKIESTSLSRSSSISKTKKAHNPDAGFSSSVSAGAKTDEVSTKSDTDKIAAIPVPDGVFHIQEVADALGSRKRSIDRGESLLKGLDVLRLALLSGRFSTQGLQDLKKLIADQHRNSIDPSLEAVLKEIEIRVHVELAKLEKENIR